MKNSHKRIRKVRANTTPYSYLYFCIQWGSIVWWSRHISFGCSESAAVYCGLCVVSIDSASLVDWSRSVLALRNAASLLRVLFNDNFSIGFALNINRDNSELQLINQCFQRFIDISSKCRSSYILESIYYAPGLRMIARWRCLSGRVPMQFSSELEHLSAERRSRIAHLFMAALEISWLRLRVVAPFGLRTYGEGTAIASKVLPACVVLLLWVLW